LQGTTLSNKIHGNKQLTWLTSKPCGQQYKEENNNTEGIENMTACKGSVRMIMKLVQ